MQDNPSKETREESRTWKGNYDTTYAPFGKLCVVFQCVGSGYRGLVWSHNIAATSEKMRGKK